jgi:hypothetical protein
MAPQPHIDPDTLDDFHAPVLGEHRLMAAIVRRAILDAAGRNLNLPSPAARQVVQADAVQWLRAGQGLHDCADVLGVDPRWFRAQCLVEAGLSPAPARLGARRGLETPATKEFPR